MSTTVFVTTEPFFGLIVSVTLQSPFLIPFTEEPVSLQKRDELESTFTEIFAPGGITTFTYFAIAVAVAALVADTTG